MQDAVSMSPMLEDLCNKTWIIYISNWIHSAGVRRRRDFGLQDLSQKSISKWIIRKHGGNGFNEDFDGNVSSSRKHSSGDLHSRLKTRKILGVGETDNGDIHRSKISQLLGHNEHLYVRFPRGYWAWHLVMALTFTFLGLNNLFVPYGGFAVSADEELSSPSSYLASRYHGCTSLALAFLLWAFWGTSDKAVIRCLLIAVAVCHILQATAVFLELIDGFSSKWQMYVLSLFRICLAFPNIYFYKGISLCGLRMRKSNSFSDVRDSQPMGNHLKNED